MLPPFWYWLLSLRTKGKPFDNLTNRGSLSHLTLFREDELHPWLSYPFFESFQAPYPTCVVKVLPSLFSGLRISPWTLEVLRVQGIQVAFIGELSIFRLVCSFSLL
jgi:hypothetical protein